MITITEKDVVDNLPMERAIEVVEQAFRDTVDNLITIGVRGTLEVTTEGNSCIFLPAAHTTKNYFTLKYAASFPTCAAQGLPTVQSVIFLFSAETGEIRAMIAANVLTAIKTGAASAVATKYLANKNAPVLTIIGAGEQAKTQLAGIAQVRHLDEVRLVDIDPNRATALKQWAEKHLAPRCRIVTSSSADESTVDADIIVTCTTSNNPVLKGDYIQPGVHINAIGSFTPQMQEIDERTVLRADKIVTDTKQEVWKYAGDLIVPFEKELISKAAVSCELGDIIQKKHTGRETSAEITLYESIGFAPLDLAVAIEVYETAVDKR